MNLKYFLISIIILFSNICLAGGATSETLFARANNLFERSLAGDESVTTVALQSFNILSMTYRDNPLFLAYKGSSYTLLGRDSWMPWNKLEYTEKGLAFIDKSLEMIEPRHDQETMRTVPISVETRLVAISTFVAVPESFDYLKKAKIVLADVLQSPAFTASPTIVQAQVYLEAAKIARSEKDSNSEIQYLQTLLKISPKSKFAKIASKRLQELK
ncbi:hypothetical protein QUF74_10135 [Candidatus Halobeggiatoa sp. HSG11]|nr:hypothetical protein [Candidatus Halobeggiatoa sp. HSG11]